MAASRACDGEDESWNFVALFGSTPSFVYRSIKIHRLITVVDADAAYDALSGDLWEF